MYWVPSSAAQKRRRGFLRGSGPANDANGFYFPLNSWSLLFVNRYPGRELILPHDTLKLS
jgi:hypothetical protein